MSGVILAALIVGGTGLILGLFLGLADKKFKVEVDEKEALIRAELPGNNCGGCGYAGCDAVAKAIAEGEAEVDVCPVSGVEAADSVYHGERGKAGRTHDSLCQMCGNLRQDAQ